MKFSIIILNIRMSRLKLLAMKINFKFQVGAVAEGLEASLWWREIVSICGKVNPTMGN